MNLMLGMHGMNSAKLLQRLEPAVRPVGDIAFRGREPIETLDFASLLQRADSGEMTSARPADASALRTSPSAEDLRDLGAALDLLASRGSQRAVILIGTRAFLADVATRSIEREIDAQDSPHGPIAVDAAIRVRPSGEESPHVFLAPPNAIRPLFADFSQDGVYTARDSQSLASTGRRDRAAVS